MSETTGVSQWTFLGRYCILFICQTSGLHLKDLIILDPGGRGEKFYFSFGWGDIFWSIHVTISQLFSNLGNRILELYLGRNSRERDKSDRFCGTSILVLIMFLSNWNVRSMSSHVSELVISLLRPPCRLKDNQDINEGLIYRASRELLGRNSRLN